MRATVASLLVTALVVVGCASPSLSPDASTMSVDLVQLAGRDLGWGGIFLGRTRADVGEALGHNLPVEHSREVLVCGGYLTPLTLHGRHVEIQWSSQMPTGTVESVFVEITPDEQATPVVQLVRRLRSRLSKLVEREPARPQDQWAYLTPREHASQALLVKSGEENFLYVSLDSCFD